LKRKLALVLALVMLLSLTACGGNSGNNAAQNQTEGQENSAQQESDEAADGQLVSEGMVELQYAQRFSIEKFQGGYRMITAGNEGTGDHKQYLVVPEGKSVPEDLAGDVVVLQLPIENVYCASSSMISLSNAIGAL